MSAYRGIHVHSLSVQFEQVHDEAERAATTNFAAMLNSSLQVNEGDRITQTDKDDVHYHESVPALVAWRR
jgi:hypothetical protein